MSVITLLANCKPAELVPPGLQLTLGTMRDVELLGFEGIQQLIQRWRKWLRDIDEHVKFIEKLSKPPSPHHLARVGLKLVELYADLETARRELRSVLPQVEPKRSEIKGKIEMLCAVRRHSERAPLLPYLRPSEWFKIGEEVVVCMKDGTVFRGVYNSIGDQGAEIVGTDPGDLVTVGLASPALRLPWEHELLTTSQEFAQFWKEQAYKV